MEGVMDQKASEGSGSNRISDYCKFEGAMDEEASDGSGSKRMSDGCYKRSNRRSNGPADGSGSRGQAVVQEGIEGAIIMFNIMSKFFSFIRMCQYKDI